MRKLITLILFSTLCFSAIDAQTGTDDYVLPKKKDGVMDKVSASVTTGAGLSFINFSKNTAFSSFVAPQIGYQLSPKLKLNIGTMHYTVSGNSLLMSPGDFRNNTGSSQNRFNSAAFGLEYKISDKSSIGISTSIGAGISNYNMNGLPGSGTFSNSMYPFGMFSSFGR